MASLSLRHAKVEVYEFRVVNRFVTTAKSESIRVDLMPEVLATVPDRHNCLRSQSRSGFPIPAAASLILDCPHASRPRRAPIPVSRLHRVLSRRVGNRQQEKDAEAAYVPAGSKAPLHVARAITQQEPSKTNPEVVKALPATGITLCPTRPCSFPPQPPPSGSGQMTLPEPLAFAIVVRLGAIGSPLDPLERCQWQNWLPDRQDAGPVVRHASCVRRSRRARTKGCRAGSRRIRSRSSIVNHR